jgi:CRISPR-associated protein (TIGR02584 family)
MESYRNLLVAVAGLTPQVITETLYYLTVHHHPPVAISEIHVLTTLQGNQRILQHLLGSWPNGIKIALTSCLRGV